MPRVKGRRDSRQSVGESAGSSPEPADRADRVGGPAGDRGSTAPSAPARAVSAKVATPRAHGAASATDALDRALKAKSPAARVRHARAGLAGLGGSRDVDLHGMLLRQLYLGELELGNYAKARVAADQLIALGVVPEVAEQDAARACQALGDFDAAVAHLQRAAIVSPPERRAFHLSTLGGLLYAIGRPEEAATHLECALVMSESVRPLIRGQLALVRSAVGDPDAAVDDAYDALAADRSGEGYGRFVLGELAYVRGDRRAAQGHLEAFVSRVKKARPASRVALAPEVARATGTLGKIVWN